MICGSLQETKETAISYLFERKKEWFVQYTETQNLTLNRRVLRGIIRGTRGLNSKACGTPKGINGL